MTINENLSNDGIERPLIKEPLKLQGFLDNYKSFNVTPTIGTEFPDANVVEWLKASNSDELLQDLAATISRRGVVFFRAQSDLTDELQKELANRLGLLTGKPESSTLHIHPRAKYNTDEDPYINIITTDDDPFWKKKLVDIRACWHTDTGYEPNPADYSILKIVKMPEAGGDTMWASSYEIYDKISPAYRTFLEGLTVTFTQFRLPTTAAEKGFVPYSEPRGSPNNVGTSLTTVHPLVRTNPVTGWKSLFGVGYNAAHINEVTTEESRRLHDWFLQMIVEHHDCQLRHRWKDPYDIAIWDNRSVYHTPVFDYAGLGARTAHRVTGVGEKPYFDPNSSTRRDALEEEKRLI